MNFEIIQSVRVGIMKKEESSPLNLDTEETIFIRKAITINDMRKVFDVRWSAYVASCPISLKIKG